MRDLDCIVEGIAGGYTVRILQPALDIDRFFQKLATARNKVLLSDYDGTLAPFREEREEATPYPGVVDALNTILTSGVTRLVLVTGRRAEDLIRLLGIDAPLEIWGSHGLERIRPDGSREMRPSNPKNKAGLSEAWKCVDDMNLSERVERKPGCLAFHVRGLDKSTSKELIDIVSEKWRSVSSKMGLDLVPFDGGIELRAPGASKGNTIETILKESGEDAAVAYLGDDMTDEDAFRALQGRGLRVLVREELRPTNADIWLVPPEELLEFLGDWVSYGGRCEE